MQCDPSLRMVAHDRLVERALAATSRRDLCEVAASYVHDLLGSQITSVSVPAGPTQELLAAVRGAPITRAFDYAREVAPGADPILAEALRSRAAVHNRDLFTDADWRRQSFYQAYARRFNCEHYLVAPLLGIAAPIGAIHVVRRPSQTAFDARSLRVAAAVASQLSVYFAVLSEVHVEDVALTVRERQVARLASEGRNNLEIAGQLGIARETVKQTLRRVYRKLDVNGRAAMAARLSAAPR
jgi:DNA-binding CsgD family transcriptional regulator